MIFANKTRRTLHWAEAFGASAVVHLGAAILVFDLLDGFSVFDPREEPEPEIIITSIILEGELAPAPEQPLTNDPLSETPTEPDVPETPPDESDPAPDEPVEQPTEPDPDPDPADIANMVPETLAPVDTQTMTALQPENQLRPEDGSAVPIAPRATTVLTPQSGTVIAAVPATRPDTGNTNTLQPRQTISTVPTPATQQAPTPQGDTASGVVNELITRIRARLADTCLLAIPQQGSNDIPELVLMGSNENSMRALADAVLADLTPQPTQRRVLIDNRQCAALNFARENRNYPTFRLSISLDETSIESGTELSGTIGNAAGRYVSLLLVDDNGVVQDLGDELTFTSGEARFDVILTRDGNPRDTSQTLVALATNTRPTTLNEQNGQSADIYFAALREELGPDTPMVLLSFEVR